MSLVYKIEDKENYINAKRSSAVSSWLNAITSASSSESSSTTYVSIGLERVFSNSRLQEKNDKTSFRLRLNQYLPGLVVGVVTSSAAATVTDFFASYVVLFCLHFVYRLLVSYGWSPLNWKLCFFIKICMNSLFLSFFKSI